MYVLCHKVLKVPWSDSSDDSVIIGVADFFSGVNIYQL